MEETKDFFPPDAGEEIPREVIAEGKRRVAIFVKIENLLDRMKTTFNQEECENLAEEIEELLNKNEKVIARSDNSGWNDLKNFRLRLDDLRPKRAAA